METNGITHLAIAGGTGKLGRLIINGFAYRAPRLRITLLVRQGSSNKAHALVAGIARFSVRIVSFEDSGLQDLADALAGHDGVLSVVGGSGLENAQMNLARAAIRAEVKYFLPSQFGIDLNFGMNFLVREVDLKRQVRVLVKKHMHCIDIFCGFFSDEFLNEDFGWDLERHMVCVPGDGNKLCSFIDREDVARYTVEVVLQASKYEGQALRFATATLSYNDLVRIGEEVTGRLFTVTRASRLGAEGVTGDDLGFSNGQNSKAAQMQLVVANGDAQVDALDYKLSNKLFPIVEPGSAEDSLRALFGRQ
ncbi:hypothetical protein FBU59_002720 [Linderina macrospora]|uniref:Uncharacterized protein n=1 Tax=Linderina macrospora TaxID=4868 RepID=A0ACC1JAN1_9FUNG|nr:hypothetical protein FBU59_002720 [Linderina macrospora]